MRNCGKLYRCVIAWYCSTNRARNSRPFRWSPWDLWDRKIWIGFNAENKIFSSLYMPRITHMLFVNTNDYFSRCSVKGGRGKTQWERLQVLYLTRPKKKKKESPHRHNWNSPHAPTSNGYHLFRCRYPPLGEITMSVPEWWHWWHISFSLRAAKSCS